ncbi:MAG: Excinuclease ABC C subunit domain protein [Parcubacteria group bacterium GW2011_GWB1_45_7]|nr:MAG: Excinuclease ABC C subunit domain protein [Parcubacteria group bacterium GW2011_GWB1_45_7]
MAWCVYVLKSQTTNKHYIGQTDNLQRRLKEHNSGKSRSSKPGIPWELIATKICASRSEAVRLERRLKNLKSNGRLLDVIAGWSSGSSSGS